MAKQEWDTIVIGGGPGGYAAAIRSAQLKLKTLLIEDDKMGGTCLNIGCIPTKYFVEFADSYRKIKKINDFGINAKVESLDLNKFQKSKEKVVKQLTQGVGMLVKKAGVTVKNGLASFATKNEINILGTGGNQEMVTGKNIIIATGSRPAEIIADFDGETVLSSTDVLNITTLPKDLIVVGAGVVGMEFASIFSQLGVHVSVVEAAERLLLNEDKDLTQMIQKDLEKRNVKFYFGAEVVFSERTKNKVTIQLKEKDGNTSSLHAEKMLIAAGRRTNIEKLNLEKVGVSTERGVITVNEKMQTSIENIYAVGDVVGGLQLAHVAYEEGITASENIAGNEHNIDYRFVPSTVFTTPQLSSVGLTEEEAKVQYDKVKSYNFPLQANSKALINGLGNSQGVAKLVIDEDYGEILGFTIVGDDIGETIADITSVMTLEGTVDEVANTIYSHPSLTEVIGELALLAKGKPLHITN